MDDLISRQAAIDGVKTLHDVAWKNWHEPTLSANVVLDMIKELPSAQLFTAEAYELGKADRPKWISVSERLPDKDKRVIVTGTMWGKWEVDIDRWNGERWVKYGGYVSAWQPLPEPYKESDTE